MALADFTAYKAAIASPQEQLHSFKALAAGASNSVLVSSQWAIAQDAGAAPTTAVVPTRSTTGALGQQDGGSGTLTVVSCELGVAGDTGSVTTARPDMGVLILADRLSHQGGLDGTSTSAQTTNLATAALTRYTDGVGVFAALEVYTNVGSTGTTATVSYTNQAGTAGQTSLAVNFGGTSTGNVRNVDHMRIIALAAGDTGVRSVESVTLAASTTTAGNFGVTLFKPLLFLPAGLNDQYPRDVVRGTMGGGMPEIKDGACLFWILCSSAGGAASSMDAVLNFTEV